MLALCVDYFRHETVPLHFVIVRSYMDVRLTVLEFLAPRAPEPVLSPCFFAWKKWDSVAYLFLGA